MVLRPLVVMVLAILASAEAWAQGDAGGAVVPPVDAAREVVEPTLDAGVAVPDAGVAAPDAGVAAPDAGVAAPDAGVAAPDAGVAAPDAGVAAPDGEAVAVAPGHEWDADGDGVLEPDEVVLQRASAETFQDTPDEITAEALVARPRHASLAVRSLTVAQFRAMVKLTRKKVLARLQARLARTAAARMTMVSEGIVLFSLSGLLLLLLPLAMVRRYPGKLGLLCKSSALAAFTFMLTVSLFGGVLTLERHVQGALSTFTNPELALSSGFFDALHDNADELVVVGRELFAPTLKRLQGNTDEQPAVALIANGQRLVDDSRVFAQVARAFASIGFVVGMIPVLLLGVTMLLLIRTIAPTLRSIIELPAQVAGGDAGGGGDVLRTSMRWVGSQLLVTLCCLVVLMGISLLVGVVLGRVVQPALEALISYFAIAVMYLRFVDSPSTVLVYVMMFSVILFLIGNLGVILVSTSFFLSKTQQIFQQRFRDGVPLRSHRRFWLWGSVAVLWALVFPAIYIVVARLGIAEINSRVMAGSSDAGSVNWTLLMLAGPLFLVVGFLVALWASRGLAAIRFLITYQVEGTATGALLRVAEQASAALGRR